MKLLAVLAILAILIGCHYKKHLSTEVKPIQGLFVSTLIETDGPTKEFLYFDTKGFVYYWSDSTYPAKKQEQRILAYGTKANVSFLKDSIIFKLDSFFIGTSSFSATAFDGKKITGEEKMYYHELKTRYSGILHNDTLDFNKFTVSMQKDTTDSKATFARYRGN